MRLSTMLGTSVAGGRDTTRQCAKDVDGRDTMRLGATAYQWVRYHAVKRHIEDDQCVDLVFEHSAKVSCEMSIPLSTNSSVETGQFYRCTWANVIGIDEAIDWMKWGRMSRCVWYVRGHR